MGVVCHINPVNAKGPNRRDGAWPARLNHFLINLFHGMELINLQTMALGGTNTETAITMWDYSLLAGDIPYPDILINVKHSEHQVIAAALHSTDSRMAAAKLLGISPRTLRYKLAQLRERGASLAGASL